MIKINQIFKKNNFTKSSYDNILTFLEAEKLKLENELFIRRVGRDLNTKYEDELDEKILCIEKSIKEFKYLEK